MNIQAFIPKWRQEKYRAFNLFENSTAKNIVQCGIDNRIIKIYANANLSIYSGQRCNGACQFCVEELRPASRGTYFRSAEKNRKR